MTRIRHSGIDWIGLGLGIGLVMATRYSILFVIIYVHWGIWRTTQIMKLHVILNIIYIWLYCLYVWLVHFSVYFYWMSISFTSGERKVNVNSQKLRKRVEKWTHKEIDILMFLVNKVKFCKDKVSNDCYNW